MFLCFVSKEKLPFFGHFDDKDDRFSNDFFC